MTGVRWWLSRAGRVHTRAYSLRVTSPLRPGPCGYATTSGAHAHNLDRAQAHVWHPLQPPWSSSRNETWCKREWSVPRPETGQFGAPSSRRRKLSASQWRVEVRRFPKSPECYTNLPGPHKQGQTFRLSREPVRSTALLSLSPAACDSRNNEVWGKAGMLLDRALVRVELDSLSLRQTLTAIERKWSAKSLPADRKDPWSCSGIARPKSAPRWRCQRVLSSQLKHQLVVRPVPKAPSPHWAFVRLRSG